ncbi:energy transducer TonB [Qipengyuania marisflavi]|uniref:TonB C-terminal domain-containing protein n=1 Tax=Qipengyuania marisflavi TaxID=2486356 RepID=A0A5S3PA40_9SPHN|nr:energy transducer TonB [Qipengyuania marisflavi]TMM50379.1 hypothetical protein FEV51_04185 [Qipengyuania marisflavi]
MIGIILGVLAMLATGPVKSEAKGSPSRWVLASDLSAIDSTSASTIFEIVIDDKGRPIRCAIVVESGSDDLDRAVCNAILKRARFKPAKDIEGTPVYSIRRDKVIWKPQAYGSNSHIDNADVMLSSSEIEVESPIFAEIIVTLNPVANQTACHVTDTSGDQKLDELACSIIKQPEFSAPLTDNSGNYVRGLRSWLIAFTHGPTTELQITLGTETDVRVVKRRALR